MFLNTPQDPLSLCRKTVKQPVILQRQRFLQNSGKFANLGIQKSIGQAEILSFGPPDLRACTLPIDHGDPLMCKLLPNFDNDKR